MADKKYGRQTMSLDAGIQDTNQKIMAWLNSIAGFAIRE